MKWFKFSFVWGKLRDLWTWLKPMLLSKVGQFLSDARVKALAIKAVEAAAKVDLDGDGKHDHAVVALAAELAAIGIEYYRGWLAIAVETAYQNIAPGE